MAQDKQEAVYQEPLFSRRDGEFLRVMASVSVVIAHCVHLWVERFAIDRSFASLGFLAALLDQFSRFTLPLFFFLSGFGLTLQFQAKPMGLKDYYRFRLVKIAAPFLLWSVMTSFRHLQWLESWDWHNHPWHSLASLGRFLFVDGLDYQYYFLIVIFQFYLVFPFLFRLAKSRAMAVGALLVHMAVTSPVETYLEVVGWNLPPLHSNVLLLHFFWCFMGMHIACNRQALTRWAGNWSLGGAFLAWAGVFALINIEFLINLAQGKALADIDHFNRWSVVIYGCATLLVFMKIKPWLTRQVIRHARGEFLFTHVAPYTFFVYLAHTHVLRTVDYFFSEVDLGDFIWRMALVVLGSYALAWFAQWLLEEFPRLRYALGLPKPALKLREVPFARRFGTNSTASVRKDSNRANLAISAEEN